jgi:ABC-2 type transport system ATP-binding protein
MSAIWISASASASGPAAPRRHAPRKNETLEPQQNTRDIHAIHGAYPEAGVLRDDGMSAAAIETTSLTKFYGESRGIKGVNLKVERGEVFGFLAPNGAGKTTTIRLLLDLIRPSPGRAQLLGLDTQRESLEVRRRKSYLPGELRLPERRTGRQFLSYLARIRGMRETGAIERLAERIELQLDRRVADLSKGNRQKIGVVAAFMHDAELLILDEPTSGLDPLRL